jgi:NAD(P)-dependent dehydrogenase (short-subunit alcohol dehydrogenase family)
MIPLAEETFGDSMLIKDKVAVVTGIGPGMGKEIALLLARHGARLAIGARSSAAVAETAAEIRAMGGEVVTATTDLADEESCAAIVRLAAETFGTVDTVVQNGAAIGDYKLVEDADPVNWRNLFEANVMGSVYLFKAALPYMKKSGDGRVILINSGAGINRAPPGLAAYGVTKAGLAGLVRSIALEAGKYGVRCNGVHLGGVDGANHQNWIEQIAAPAYGMTKEQYMEMRYNEYLPLRSVPTAEECAGIVLFLASDLARAITGQAISVNGGEWFGG